MKYRPQPAREVLHQQRWSVRAAAREIGVGYPHLTNALKGLTRPNPTVREKLPELLGVPLEDLFTADMIRLPFTGDLGVGRRPKSATGGTSRV